MPGVGALNSNLRLFRLARTWRGDDFATVPGMVVLGCSGIRAVSRFSSASLADLAMRGFAISLLTLARVALSESLLVLLCGTLAS
jgi:hypothetical protein